MRIQILLLGAVLLIAVFPIVAIPTSSAYPGACTVVTPDGGSPTTSFVLTDVVTSADWIVDSADCAQLRPTWDLDHGPVWAEEGSFNLWTDDAGQLHMAASHNWGRLSEGAHDIIGTVYPDGCMSTCNNEWTLVVTSDPTVGTDSVGTGPHSFSFETPASASIPYEVIGPVQVGPYTQPLPPILRVSIDTDDRGLQFDPSGTTTIPTVDAQEMTGEPVPLSVCKDPKPCTFPLPSVAPFGGSGSLSVSVLTIEETIPLP
jgi:hypothetical protein